MSLKEAAGRSRKEMMREGERNPPGWNKSDRCGVQKGKRGDVKTS